MSLECDDFLACLHFPHLEVWSKLAEIIRLASGVKTTAKSSPLCHLRVNFSFLMTVSHTFTVSSQLPEAICFPFQLNATLLINA